MSVPPWLQNRAPAVATAGVAAAPAAAAPASCGPSFGALLLSSIAATALVLFVRGKVREAGEEQALEALGAAAERAQLDLDAHREDLAIAHDLGTAHPLSLRYGEP